MSISHIGFFPWCIWPNQQAFIDYAQLNYGGALNYEDLQNYFEPVKSNLSTIMALYWRVKKWRVSGNFQYTKETSGDPPEPVIETVPYEFFFERDKNPESLQNDTTEKDLICLVNPDPSDPEYPKQSWDIIQFRRTGDPIEIETDFGTGIWGADFVAPTIFTFPAGVKPIIKQENNVYSSGLYFTLNFEDGLEPDVDTYRGGFLGLAENEESSNAAVTISFLGQTFNLLAIDNNAEEEPVPLISTMNIEAVEYWPYDPEDGNGPIYDSTTGAQLRPFP